MRQLRGTSTAQVPGAELVLVAGANTDPTGAVILRRAPLGDPMEIRLRGYSLALRPGEANALQFEVVDA